MNALLVPIVLLTAAAAPAGESNPWLSEYGEALEAARRQERPLVVVLEKSEVPTERLDQTLTADETQQQLLKPYVLCRVDVSTSYGKKVAAAFDAERFPHTAVIDKQAKRILYRKRGHFTHSEWVETLVKYRQGERVPAVVTSTSSWIGGSSFFPGQQAGACRT